MTHLPPRELRDLKRWCRWRLETPPGGSPTKRPLQSTKNVDALLDFSTAGAAGPVDATQGIGFVFTGAVRVDGSLLIALDIDACRDPITGEVMDWALAILGAHNNSCTEITPSGTGLRQWLLVKHPPNGLLHTKVDVPHPAPVDVLKKPNVQVFGLGSAQYVTVTGDLLRGTTDRILVVDTIDWLVEHLDLGISDEPSGKLPVGTGEEPTLDEIDAQMRRAHADLVDGAATAAHREGSPSEAYFVLVQHVLRAARGHGEAAVDYLLQRTAWGRGEILGSKDPTRYARETWVRGEVARIAAKRLPVPAAEVFGDPSDPPPTTLPGLIHPTLADFLRGEDEAEFLVWGLLPRIGLVQFFGDPASGKTPFALSLAIHVAGGKSHWFDHKIDRHGPVVYMVGEGAAGLRKRVRAEMMLHRLQPENVHLLPTKRPGRLTDEDEPELWAREIQKVAPGGAALLVVDTQSMNFGPANENATEDMQRFVDHLVALAKRARCLVALVHHTGHTNKERGRGSSVLFAAIDATFEVTREGRCITATPGKSKDWEAPAPLVGMLEVVEVRKDRDGRPVTAVCLRTEAPTPGEVFADLQDAFAEDDGLLRVLSEVARRKGEPVTVRQIADAVDLTEKQARARLDRLGSLALLESGGNPRSRAGMTYTLTDKGDILIAQAEGNVRAQMDTQNCKSATDNEFCVPSAPEGFEPENGDFWLQ